MNLTFITHPSSPLYKISFSLAAIFVLQLIILPWAIKHFLKTKHRIESAILWCEFLGTTIIGAAMIPNPHILNGGFPAVVQIFDPYIGVLFVYAAFNLKFHLHSQKKKRIH